MEECLAEEQFGFRSGRGCTDAVHILGMVTEKSSEWGEPLFLAALDVEKAFDRVHHAELFGALLRCGVGTGIVNALRRLYAEMGAKVYLWSGMEGRSLQVQRGVGKGILYRLCYLTWC